MTQAARKNTMPKETGVQTHRWDVEQFYRAVRAGVFATPERLELIEGEIVETTPAQETPHIQATLLCAEALRTLAGTEAHVRTQTPLDIDRHTEPEPDIMVVRGKLRDYDGRKPKPEDVLLLVEVSDTTLNYDLSRKAALYAEAGIEEYWVLDVRHRQLKVFRGCALNPHGPDRCGYADQLTLDETESWGPVLFANGAPLPIESLLPRKETS